MGVAFSASQQTCEYFSSVGGTTTASGMEVALKQNITTVTVSVGTCTSPVAGVGTGQTTTVYTTDIVTACPIGATCSAPPATWTGVGATSLSSISSAIASPSSGSVALGSGPVVSGSTPTLPTANTGIGDSGIGDTGNNDSGDYDSGDNDSGNYDSGNWDSGNYDTGDHESTNGNAGGASGRDKVQVPGGFIGQKEMGA